MQRQSPTRSIRSRPWPCHRRSGRAAPAQLFALGDASNADPMPGYKMGLKRLRIERASFTRGSAIRLVPTIPMNLQAASLIARAVPIQVDDGLDQPQPLKPLDPIARTGQSRAPADGRELQLRPPPHSGHRRQPSGCDDGGWPRTITLDFRLLRNLKGVVDLDAEVLHR